MRQALLRGLLAAPHLLLAGGATALGVVASFAMGAVVVATGRRPESLIRFQVWVVRERVRCFSYLFLLRHDYPAIPSFSEMDDDRATTVECPRGPSPLSRHEPLKRLLSAIPRAVVGVPIAAALDLVYPLEAIFVAVNRGWPGSIAARLAHIEVWAADTLLYLFLVSDVAPSIVPLSRRAVAAEGSAASRAFLKRRLSDRPPVQNDGYWTPTGFASRDRMRAREHIFGAVRCLGGWPTGPLVIRHYSERPVVSHCRVDRECCCASGWPPSHRRGSG